MEQIPSIPCQQNPPEALLEPTYLLQTPSNQHLRRGPPILFHQRLQQRVVESTPSDNRTIRLEYDTSLLAPFHDVWTAEPRMQFPLPYTYLTTSSFAMLTLNLLDVCLELIEMVDAVV